MSMQSSQAQRPSAGFRAVTPDDDTDLVNYVRGIYVGGTGDVVVQNASGATVTFLAVPAGVVLPISPKRVMEATTATGLIALQ